MGVDFYKKTFPAWYKDWLFESLNIQDGQEVSEKYLAPLFSLNKNWLKENYDQQEYSWDESSVARSYALYYMTINIPKLWMVLRNSGQWKDEAIPTIETVSEFGAGPGTFLWSYLFFLRAHKPESLLKLKKITAVDISQEHLNTAQKLFNGLQRFDEFKHLKADFICKDWHESFDKNTSDLNIFGNSLIESGMDENFIQKSKLKNILIIEPGTLEQFKRLRKIKDSLTSEEWHIHFPCPTNNKCPMTENNWCHFHVNRFILPFIQKISSAAGRKNHRHNFSAFLISKHNNKSNEQHYRMLSPNRKAKRTSIRYICNGKKLHEAVLNRKEKSELNKEFSSCETASYCETSSKLKKSRILANETFRQIDNCN